MLIIFQFAWYNNFTKNTATKPSHVKAEKKGSDIYSANNDHEQKDKLIEQSSEVGNNTTDISNTQ